MIVNVVFAYVAGSFLFSAIHLIREGGKFTDGVIAGFPESHPPTDWDVLISVVASAALTIFLSPILIPFSIAVGADSARVHARKGGDK